MRSIARLVLWWFPKVEEFNSVLVSPTFKKGPTKWMITRGPLYLPDDLTLAVDGS